MKKLIEPIQYIATKNFMREIAEAIESKREKI